MKQIPCLYLLSGWLLLASPGLAIEKPGAADEATRGPHNGRLLRQGDFAIELTIFESGQDPEFRAYPYLNETALAPAGLELQVTLTRLDGRVDEFSFHPRQDYLLGGGVVTEPHSFVVTVTASHAGQRYRWSYDSFEGRTRILTDAATASGIDVEQAAPQTIRETLTLHGVVVPDPARVYRLKARFPGLVREVRYRLGDAVAAGATLLSVESNESLQSYAITAPAAGVVVGRDVNPGMMADDAVLMTLADLSTLWVELSAFTHDIDRIHPGQSARIFDVDGHQLNIGVVDHLSPLGSPASQTMTARVVLPNPDGRWRPGMFVTGELTTAETQVPIAVRRSALQPFRDWIVVFERVGDTYEIRPLTLGREDADRVEVLKGLTPGADYVTEGSYLIKADIEKSAAVHDH